MAHCFCNSACILFCSASTNSATYHNIHIRFIIIACRSFELGISWDSSFDRIIYLLPYPSDYARHDVYKGTQSEATRNMKSECLQMLMTKKTLTKFAIYIAFGVVMTITLACAVTVLVVVPGGFLSSRYVGTSSEERRAWFTIIEKGFGRCRVERSFHEPDDGPLSGTKLPILSAPGWCRALGTPTDIDANYMGSTYYDDASGWPFVCFATHIEDSYVRTSGNPPLTVQSTVTWGIPIERSSFGSVRTAIPLKPLVLGFLGDVLVFALGAWGLVSGCRALRHYGRRSQGLCPLCEYDLQGEFTNGCPECGWGRGEPK